MNPISMSKGRIVALAAAAAVGGAVIGVVVSQLGTAGAAGGASPSAAPTQRPMPPWMAWRGAVPEPLGPPGFGGELAGRILHGEATIAKPGGGTMIVRAQNGRITGLNGSQVTVRSSDGFVATYTVDSATRIVLNGADGALSSLKSGDQVRVFGVVSGSAVHAKAVVDGVTGDFRPFFERRLMRHERQQWKVPAG